MSVQVVAPKAAWSKRGIRVGSWPCHHALIEATSSARRAASVGKVSTPSDGNRDDRMYLLTGQHIGTVGCCLGRAAAPARRERTRRAPQRNGQDDQEEPRAHARAQ